MEKMIEWNVEYIWAQFSFIKLSATIDLSFKVIKILYAD